MWVRSRAQFTFSAVCSSLLATQPLVDAKQFSFNGYWRTDHRELIDHAVVSSAMKPHVKTVQIFQDNWTPVASDHFPLMVKLSSE